MRRECSTRRQDHSAGRACVVAIRHPQVFSFPSVGIAGHLPALGAVVRPLSRGRTTVPRRPAVAETD